jgi:hypothetical protein
VLKKLGEEIDVSTERSFEEEKVEKFKMSEEKNPY